MTAANLRDITKQPQYDALFSYIVANVRQIVLEGRERQAAIATVCRFMHTYALMQPRNAPVQDLGLGPWLIRNL